MIKTKIIAPVKAAFACLKKKRKENTKLRKRTSPQQFYKSECTLVRFNSIWLNSDTLRSIFCAFYLVPSPAAKWSCEGSWGIKPTLPSWCRNLFDAFTRNVFNVLGRTGGCDSFYLGKMTNASNAGTFHSEPWGLKRGFCRRVGYVRTFQTSRPEKWKLLKHEGTRLHYLGGQIAVLMGISCVGGAWGRNGKGWAERGNFCWVYSTTVAHCSVMTWSGLQRQHIWHHQGVLTWELSSPGVSLFVDLVGVRLTPLTFTPEVLIISQRF